jgi:hypothetical protein
MPRNTIRKYSGLSKNEELKYKVINLIMLKIKYLKICFAIKEFNHNKLGPYIMDMVIFSMAIKPMMLES